MGRKHRRREEVVRQLPSDGAAYFGTQSVWVRGILMQVRRIGAQGARKFYVCPGCYQNIPPGVAHVVAWEPGREEERRHWHRPCWDRIR